jgi:hypothetical protein
MEAFKLLLCKLNMNPISPRRRIAFPKAQAARLRIAITAGKLQSNFIKGISGLATDANERLFQSSRIRLLGSDRALLVWVVRLCFARVSCGPSAATESASARADELPRKLYPVH